MADGGGLEKRCRPSIQVLHDSAATSWNGHLPAETPAAWPVCRVQLRLTRTRRLWCFAGRLRDKSRYRAWALVARVLVG